MELVLNKSFGSFGLNDTAKMKILEKKGIKDFNFYNISRLDKELIETVKELGDKSGDEFAYLIVVEIPDGASFKISDHDGVETAHFGFQTGSV